MNKHKWHKEIKAWADGADVEARRLESWGWSDWTCVSDVVFNWFEDEVHEYRIKPQPKEPQYLYIWKPNDEAEDLIVSDRKPTKNDITDDGIYKLIGKVKLEVDDE